MRNDRLQHLSDRELWRQIRIAQRRTDDAAYRYHGTGGIFGDGHPDNQEARHLLTVRSNILARLFVEEERRGGYDAVLARLREGNGDVGHGGES